jgi:hypothetical protein
MRDPSAFFSSTSLSLSVLKFLAEAPLDHTAECAKTENTCLPRSISLLRVRLVRHVRTESTLQDLQTTIHNLSDFPQGTLVVTYPKKK